MLVLVLVLVLVLAVTAPEEVMSPETGSKKVTMIAFEHYATRRNFAARNNAASGSKSAIFARIGHAADAEHDECQ